ncbi:MAG: hypothetical protein K9J13_09650 [Saprospiraceae bacterium]|nr:hypothetical protein [Saprospiraceae bacterium]
MKFASKLKYIITLIILSFLFSCAEKEEYPVTPYIKFESFIKYTGEMGNEDKGKLDIFFTDGDGDIGLDQGDTLAPFNPESKYYYNFFIQYLEKINGKFEAIYITFYNPETQEFDTITHNARIPPLTTNLVNKGIKGNIEIALDIYNYINPVNDTIAFDVYIVDKALHKSNVIRTPEIIVKK